MLEDIAVLTNGKAITEDLGLKLENIRLEDLGKAKKVTIDKDNTTIVEGEGTKERHRGPGSSRSEPRLRRPPRTTTERSCRSDWPSWSEAWR